MDLYIYYQVRREHAAALLPRVQDMQRRLSGEYAMVTGLKRRPQEKDGHQTWMEIYQAIPDGFETALDRAIAHEGLETLIDGQRHTEHFVDISSCA